MKFLQFFRLFYLSVFATSLQTAGCLHNNVWRYDKQNLKHETSSEQKIQMLYWQNRDRFLLRCMSENKKPIIFHLEKPNPQDSQTIGHDNVTITAEYPDKMQARNQLVPQPHFFVQVKIQNRDNVVKIQKARVNEKGSVNLKVGKYVHRCILFTSPSKPFSINPSKSKLVHFVVHPHRFFDQTGKLKSKLEPYLLDEDIESHIFFEGHGMPYNLVKAANRYQVRNDALWDASQDVALEYLGNASLHIAPNGVFTFNESNETKFPKSILMTGGHLSRCVAWLIAHISENFSHSSNQRLDFILPTPLLVLGRAMKESEGPQKIGKKLIQEVVRISDTLGLNTSDLSYRIYSHELNTLENKNLRRTIKHFDLPSLESSTVHQKKVVVFNILWHKNKKP